MDRGKLIAMAPDYYACAICAFFFQRDNGAASVNTLWGNIEGMSHIPTFTHVLKHLVEKDMLEAVYDDFGPTIYVRTDGFSASWQEMRSQTGTPYFKWNIDPQGGSWLVTALDGVNKALEEQNITEEDFTKPDFEWQPLPVERDDPKLEAATQAIDETITEIQRDNGYAANVPGERDFVLDSLTTVSRN